MSRALGYGLLTGGLGEFPEPHRAVEAPRGQIFSLRREGHGINIAGVTVERRQLLTAEDIPEHDRVIVGAGGHEGPVGRERDRRDPPGAVDA